MGAALTACVRYLLFFFNLVFALTGLGTLVLGGVVQYQLDNHDYSTFIDESFRYVPIAVMVVGAAIAIIAFFGCCGAFKESHCMLFAFGILLSTLFVLEIAAGVAGYVFRNDVARTVEERFEKGVKDYYTDPDVHKIMDGVQFDLACCGAHGPTDYVPSKIPNSCCSNLSPDQQCLEQTAHHVGCFDAAKNWFINISLIMVSLGGGIAFIQLIGIIFSFCLANSIKRGYEIV